MTIFGVEPRVQLAGHTVYFPPTDGDGELLLKPHSQIATDWLEGGDPQELVEFAGRACYQSFGRPNPRTATLSGYLNHILEVGHFSILEHASVTFYVTGVSRTLTHELVRHRHLSYSQLSQRYVDAATGVGLVIPPAVLALGDTAEYSLAEKAIDEANEATLSAYRKIQELLEADGVHGKLANQAARAVLMGMTETRIVVTGNYRAWMNFLLRRDDMAADEEIRDLARMIGHQLAVHAPYVFGDQPRAIWGNRKEV